MYQKIEIVVLVEESRGGQQELNLISWNDKEPKYDIREWTPEYTKMGKGVTPSKEEIVKLKEVLSRKNL